MQLVTGTHYARGERHSSGGDCVELAISADGVAQIAIGDCGRFGPLVARSKFEFDRLEDAASFLREALAVVEHAIAKKGGE